jgi:hypothetical protein
MSTERPKVARHQLQKPSDLDQYTQENFPWGNCLNRYEVGPYLIFEFHPWKMKDYCILTGQLDRAKLKYHCFVNGEDLGKEWDTLDEALAHCIAFRHEGAESRAATYFLRMLCHH